MALTSKPANIYFEVDSDLMTRAMREATEDLEKLVTLVAHALGEELQHEGRSIAPALGEEWDVSTGVSPWSRTVSAPEDAWWAHFVARGTKEHGPRNAEKLLFTIDGEMIGAERVKGMAANPFDTRAIARTRSHVDEILRRLI